MEKSRLRAFVHLAILSLLLAQLAGCAVPASPTPLLAATPALAPTAPGALPPQPTATKAAPAANRPNIIFILTDDLDVQSIVFMPKLKALLVSQGISFSNFFVNVSLCCPSRTSILCGQYAHNTQIFTNSPPDGGFETVYSLGRDKSTVATWLQEAGYRTALIGKYLNGYPQGVDKTYIPPGWSEWYSPVAGNAYSDYNYTLNENGKLVAYGSKPEDYETDVISRKAADFIQRTAKENKPFFAYLSPYVPHSPATAAPRHEALFPDARAPRPPSFNEEDVSDKPAYIRNHPPLTAKEIANLDDLYRKRLRTLQAVDEMIANLVDTLKATGRLDNTYIFFTSDNGFHLGQHRLLQGKTAPYEEDILVPLIVRGPGVPAGQVVDHLTGNVDLAPTLAELAGLQIPDSVDGRSLLPLLRNNPPAISSWRQFFLLEHGAPPEKAPQKQQQKTKQADLWWQNPLASLVQFTAENAQIGQLLSVFSAASAVKAESPERWSDAEMSGLLEPDDSPDDAPQAQQAGRGIPGFQALRSKDYTYVEYVTGERELYDLKQDPYQLRNLAKSAQPAMLAQLSAKLKELATCKGATCRAAESAPLVMVKNAGHGFTPVGGPISPTRAELTRMVADFFDRNLK